jgi:hypothetical protein
MYKSGTNAIEFIALVSGLSFLLLSHTSVAEEKAVSLAEQARDPTASLTAFQIRFDHINSFHNLPGADQSQLVLQPIIPWKWGEQKHIARITAPYITNAPDWGILADEAANGLPPNYVPTADQEGLGDIAAVDLLIFDTSWGRQGIGAAIVMPTASDPALGSEKWSIGPAYVAITKFGSVNAGMLTQWLVSFAGESDRDDLNSLTLQPFAGYGFSDGWSVQLSEMVFNYDFERSRWNSLPIGGRIEKLVKIGSLSSRVYFEYEHNFQNNDVAPEDIVRIAFVPLF